MRGVRIELEALEQAIEADRDSEAGLFPRISSPGCFFLAFWGPGKKVFTRIAVYNLFDTSWL